MTSDAPVSTKGYYAFTTNLSILINIMSLVQYAFRNVTKDSIKLRPVLVLIADYRAAIAVALQAARKDSSGAYLRCSGNTCAPLKDLYHRMCAALQLRISFLHEELLIKRAFIHDQVAVLVAA